MLNRTPARAIIRLDPNSISSGYAHPVEFKIFDDEYDIHDLGTQSLIDQNEALYLFHIFVLVVEVRDIAKFQTAMWRLSSLIDHVQAIYVLYIFVLVTAEHDLSLCYIKYVIGADIMLEDVYDT